MADITIKRTGEIVRNLFDILIKHPEGMRAHEALAAVADSLTLNEHEAGIYQSNGARRFEKIVRFATIPYVKAGWMIKQKGAWTITEQGIAAHQKFKDPETFSREANKLYRAWRANQKGLATTSTSDEPLDEKDAEQSSAITFEQAEEQAWNEVERFLKSMNPYEFQELVADLLRGMQYYVSWVAPPGKDGGVDIIAHPDPLGTQSPRLKVQVKRHADARVDHAEVRSFLSTINGDDAGLFVSTSGFTRDAESFARMQESRKIMLIDLERFFELWVKFHDKLSDEARRRFPVTPVHFFTPEI